MPSIRKKSSINIYRALVHYGSKHVKPRSSQLCSQYPAAAFRRRNPSSLSNRPKEGTGGARNKQTTSDKPVDNFSVKTERKTPSVFDSTTIEHTLWMNYNMQTNLNSGLRARLLARLDTGLRAWLRARFYARLCTRLATRLCTRLRAWLWVNG